MTLSFVLLAFAFLPLPHIHTHFRMAKIEGLLPGGGAGGRQRRTPGTRTSGSRAEVEVEEEVEASPTPTSALFRGNLVADPLVFFRHVSLYPSDIFFDAKGRDYSTKMPHCARNCYACIGGRSSFFFEEEKK